MKSYIVIRTCCGLLGASVLFWNVFDVYYFSKPIDSVNMMLSLIGFALGIVSVWAHMRLLEQE